MSSPLEQAKESFDFSLGCLENLLINKEKIIEGLQELSIGVRGREGLFDYRVNVIYEYLEDDFSPSINLLKEQIEGGKLSKRKYNILLEDTNSGEPNDIFFQILAPIQKLFVNERAFMLDVTGSNKKAWFGYNKLYDWLDMLRYSIFAIKDIIRYGLESEDSDYYYFEWYNKGNEKKAKKDGKKKRRSSGSPKKCVIDKRTLREDIEVINLEYKIDNENYSLLLYIKGEKKVYQNILFLDLGLTYKSGKPNVRGIVFNNLLEGKKVPTALPKNRQHISKINRTFRELLELNDKDEVVGKSDGGYTLRISKKVELFEEKTSGDILGHPARYSSLDENFNPKLDNPFANDSEFIGGGEESEESMISLDKFEEEEHSHTDNFYEDNY